MCLCQSGVTEFLCLKKPYTNVWTHYNMSNIRIIALDMNISNLINQFISLVTVINLPDSKLSWRYNIQSCDHDIQ